MAQVALKINVAERGIVKTMQFDSRTSVYDACTMIRQKIPEAANLGNRKWTLVRACGCVLAAAVFFFQQKIMAFS